MVFVGFLCLLLIIDLKIIYCLNGFIFDNSLTLTPIIINYKIDRNKNLGMIKQDIIYVLTQYYINVIGVWFYYLKYNDPQKEFIPNDKDGELIVIVYQKDNLKLCQHAFLLLKTVKSITLTIMIIILVNISEMIIKI